MMFGNIHGTNSRTFVQMGPYPCLPELWILRVWVASTFFSPIVVLQVNMCVGLYPPVTFSAVNWSLVSVRMDVWEPSLNAPVSGFSPRSSTFVPVIHSTSTWLWMLDSTQLIVCVLIVVTLIAGGVIWTAENMVSKCSNVTIVLPTQIKWFLLTARI